MSKERDPEEVHVAVTKVRNGYLVYHEGSKYVFASFDDVVRKIGQLLHKEKEVEPR